MSVDPRRVDPTRAPLQGGDPLRALASLGVLVGHVALYALAAALAVDVDTIGPSESAAHFGALGWLMAILGNGVWVFFVLSGYLIPRPYVGAWIRGRPRPSLRRYVRNRVVRIVPAFWVVVLATAVVLGTAGASPLDVLAVPAFLQVYRPSAFGASINQAWTLGAELGFYALVPLAAWGVAWVAGRVGTPATPERRALLVVALATGVAVVSLGSSFVLGTTPTRLRWLPAILFAFMPGVAIAALEHVVPPRLGSPARTARVALGVALGGAALYALAIAPALPGGAGRPLVALGAGLVLLGVALVQWGTGRVWRVLDSAPLRWAGERSYSIYLVHIGLLLLVGRHLPDGTSPWTALAVVAGICVPGTLVLADLLFRAVERPGLRLRAPAGTAAAPAQPAARAASTARTSASTSPAHSSGASVPTTSG